MVDETIHKTIHMADEMLNLANEGEAIRNDVSSGVLFGILRDSAYKIKKIAEHVRTTNRGGPEGG